MLYSQTSQPIDKKWSRIQLNSTEVSTPNFDYKYTPNPQYQYYKLNGTDAVINPNYRILPTTNSTQSELSIDIHPTNSNILFAGANATPWPVSTVWGTGTYWSTNAGTNWSGSDNPSSLFGSTNSGDPAAVIGPNGYLYMGYIRNAGGQGVSVSTNNGVNWTSYTAGADPSSSSDLLDKNHLWVDKKNGSPYQNRVYDAWSNFVTGSASNNQVVINYSTNFGSSWSSFVDLSASLSPGSHAQGVNINTGPAGQVYATFAIYDNFPSQTAPEDAIGFAKSTDGGATWTKARIYGALTPNGNFNFGIRGYLKTNQIRVSSFPSMTVDRSGGAYNGYIYIVWPQKNVSPAGSDPDIVLIRSTDGGTTWSSPVRVNNDALNNGRDQYYPWCTVDQSNGRLSIVFYDSRHTTTNDSTGVWMATSVDGGLTFENFKVSDANFKPKPITGLASGYQGDYIGITAANGKTYPFWSDDRTGNYQAWMTQVTFGPSITHTALPNTEDQNGPYIVNATITSQNTLIPSSIKVYWGRGVGVISDSILMTNTSGDNFQASIPGNGLPNTYNYYIKAADNMGFVTTSPGGAPLTYYSFTAATDLIPPSITHSPIGNTPQVRWPVDVQADVTDNIGIQSVQCEFRINGGSISTFSLPLNSGNTYKGTFPGTVNVGDLVEYKIKATDNSLQNNFSYNPASGFHSFNILALAEILVAYDSSSTNGRTSKDSVVTYLNTIGKTYDLFNKGGQTSTNVVTFRGRQTVIWVGEATSVMSTIQKDSIKAYLNNPLPGTKSNLIIFSEDIGYQFGRSASSYYDLNFMNQYLGANYVLDRPSSGASQGLVGVYLNTGLTDSTVGTWPDVLSRFDTATTHNLYKFRGDNSINAIGKIGSTFNVATFGVDIRSLRRASDSPTGSPVPRFLNAALLYVSTNGTLTNFSLNLTAMLEGFCDGSTMVPDTVTVELRSNSSPYSLVQSKKIFLNNLGTGTTTFTTVSDGTPYYIVLKHRNGLETWSAAGQLFTSGTLNYNFTSAQNKAYGNNLIQKGTKWCVYSGDVNKDEFIDGTDVSSCFNSANLGESGYIVFDLTGDDFVDGSDLALAFNNNNLGIQALHPSSKINDEKNTMIKINKSYK